MSFSQKHQGKVLTPWFNLEEWKSVKNYIFLPEQTNWGKALKILKVWKMRTPLLSAGVEGTLIVLETLEINNTKLTEFELSHVLSTSLMRFLNLCAANNDKQGTFYQAAIQNELPPWLINIRHDIAHSHKVPSVSILYLCLKFSLNWLKEKYWDVQEESMADLEVLETEINANFEQLIEFYVILSRKIHLGEQIQSEKKMFEKIGFVLKCGDKKIGEKKLFKNLCTKIAETMKRGNKFLIGEQVWGKISQNDGIFAIPCEYDENEKKVLSVDVIKIWRKLLKIMHEEQILQFLVAKLFQFVTDEKNEFSYRETASLWIGEIFKGLNNIQENTKNLIKFTSRNQTMQNKIFAMEIITKATPFTENFISEVLQHNMVPADFIEDSIRLIEATQVERCTEIGKIRTIDDLELDLGALPQENMEISQENGRWSKVQDAVMYANLPLGVLPHQSRCVNPVFDYTQ